MTVKFELICRAVCAVGVIAVLVAGIVWLARRHRLIVERVKVLNLDKRRSDMVLERMADGIIAINRAGEVTLSNPAADQICGIRHPFVIGSQIEDTDAHPEIMRLAYECIASGEIMKSEIKLPGWPQRVVSIQSVPFSEDDSGTQAAMVILHDLTDVRRHEKNHKEFVGNVSHELKTPITAIRTTAEVLLDGAKNDPDFVDQFLSTIISETDRLSALIEDLLEIARQEWSQKICCPCQVAIPHQSFHREIQLCSSRLKVPVLCRQDVWSELYQPGGSVQRFCQFPRKVFLFPYPAH